MMRFRRTIIFISFLLFPVTIWYFSPYLIIQAMFQHILNGSFFVFMAMLVISIFAGRAWCGYFCPAGGLQECCMRINDKPAKQGKRNNIKYVLWCIWMIGIIVTYILGKNDVTIDFFYMTDHGISVTEIYNYIIYYGVLFLFVVPALVHGKRAACHYFCWMAPFMVIGSTIGRFLHIPLIARRPRKIDFEKFFKEGRKQCCNIQRQSYCRSKWIFQQGFCMLKKINSESLNIEVTSNGIFLRKMII